MIWRGLTEVYISRRVLKQPWILKTNKHCHNSDPPPPPPFLFKGGEGGYVNFDYLPRRGRTWKIKRGGWMYGAGAGLLKREGWHFSYLIFSRFIILNFAKLCYAFEQKLFFSTTIILGKKVILICPKMNMKIN